MNTFLISSAPPVHVKANFRGRHKRGGDRPAVQGPDSVTTLCLPSMTSIIRRRVKTVGAAPVLATVAAHLLDVIARHELDASFLQLPRRSSRRRRQCPSSARRNSKHLILARFFRIGHRVTTPDTAQPAAPSRAMRADDEPDADQGGRCLAARSRNWTETRATRSPKAPNSARRG